MELLKQKILQDGRVIGNDVLKVDGFLNHRIDVKLSVEMGREFSKLFSNCTVTKILTVEASGIGLACLTAQFFNCDVVFAKKSASRTQDSECFSAPCHSFTRGSDNILRVSKAFLCRDDKLLIIDDFLANGEAVRAMLSLAHQAGAEVVGVGIAIEKGFQPGGDELRAQGINLHSLAIVQSMDGGIIKFR